MAKTKVVKLFIPQGATYRREFVYKDKTTRAALDLTGYTARCQFRASASDATVLYDATTANGKMEIDGATGTVALLVSPTDSDGWTFTSAVYDIELVSPTAEVTRLVQGQVVVDPNVTR